MFSVKSNIVEVLVVFVALFMVSFKCFFASFLCTNETGAQQCACLCKAAKQHNSNNNDV